MFKQYMSYGELQQAIGSAITQQRSLTEAETHYLERSIHEPFLRKVIELYPFAPPLRKCIKASLEKMRTKLEFDTHSGIYLSGREKTLSFLEQHYPTKDSMDILARTRDLITEFLLVPEIQQQLESLEAERYSERTREYESGELKHLSPQKSLKEIQDDFGDFLKYLEKHHYSKSKTAWRVLNSLFQYIDAISDPNNQRDARIVLFFTLDAARTAYHAENKKIEPNKDYTCMPGLEEHLLDAHLFLSDPSGSPEATEKIVRSLIEPFVKSTGSARYASDLLLKIYQDAAEYHREKISFDSYVLSPGTEQKLLKQQYERHIISKNNELLTKEKQKLMNAFQRVLNMLGLEPCDEITATDPDVMDFLQKNRSVEVKTIHDTRINPPSSPKSRSDILDHMLAIGPFIDRAHLELIIALQSADNSFKEMDELIKYGSSESENIQGPSRENFLSSYSEYTANGLDCYPFYTEHLTSALFKNINEIQKNDVFNTVFCCPESVLCQWLNHGLYGLTQQQGCDLALLCAKEGYLEALKILFKKGFATHLTTDKNRTTLSLINIAARSGHVPLVAFLLDRGHNINALERPWFKMYNLVRVPTFMRTSLLMIAAEQGNLALLHFLIEKNAAINLRNDWGWTALFSAAKAGHLDAVKALIEAGADVDLKNTTGSTALIEAAKAGHVGVIKALIEAGAEIDLKDITGSTALIEAAKAGRLEVVEALIAAGADVDLKNTTGSTALIEAAENGRLEVVKALIAVGADVNQKNNSRENVLTVLINKPDVLQKIGHLLLEAGVSLDARNNKFIDNTVVLLIEFSILLTIGFVGTLSAQSLLAIKLTLYTYACYFSLSNVLWCAFEYFLSLLGIHLPDPRREGNQRRFGGKLMVLAMVSTLLYHNLRRHMIAALLPMAFAFEVVAYLAVTVYHWSFNNLTGLLFFFEPLLAKKPCAILNLEKELINAIEQNNLRELKNVLAKVPAPLKPLDESVANSHDTCFGIMKKCRQHVRNYLNINRLSDGRTALDVAVASKNTAAIREILLCPNLAPWALKKAISTCKKRRELSDLLPILEKKEPTPLLQQEEKEKLIADLNAIYSAEARHKRFISFQPIDNNPQERAPLMKNA